MSENKSAPVILIGTRKSDGSLGAVGLYEDAGEAQAAIWRNDVPGDCYYSVMLPGMGQTIALRDAGVCGTCHGRRFTGEGDACAECTEPA